MLHSLSTYIFIINTYMPTKLIDTFILPEVQQELGTIVPHLNGRHPYETNIKQWLSPIVDLTGFFVYPVNGITEAINWWASKEQRNIHKADGDYEWVDEGMHNLWAKSNDVLYMTCPSSIDGNYVDIPTDVPVVLDIAYVGTTAIKKINIPPNVEKVFFSLSKPFGISNIRTGWYFTRRPDAKLNWLHVEAQYYNYCALQYAEHLINTYSLDYVHSKLKAIQADVCRELNVTPSDCVWLATSKDKKYTEYQRSGNIARLCITKLIKVKYNGRN